MNTEASQQRANRFPPGTREHLVRTIKQESTPFRTGEIQKDLYTDLLTQYCYLLGAMIMCPSGHTARDPR
jgi:hypothetical protein